MAFRLNNHSIKLQPYDRYLKATCFEIMSGYKLKLYVVKKNKIGIYLELCAETDNDIEVEE